MTIILIIIIILTMTTVMEVGKIQGMMMVKQEFLLEEVLVVLLF